MHVLYLLICGYWYVHVPADSVTGELKISNHSQSFAGMYLCKVNNGVGAEQCRINLKVNKRK